MVKQAGRLRIYLSIIAISFVQGLQLSVSPVLGGFWPICNGGGLWQPGIL